MADLLGEGVERPQTVKYPNILDALFVDTPVDITSSVASLRLLYFVVGLGILSFSSSYLLFSNSLLLEA